MMPASDDSSSNPPPPNPLQTAYDDFLQNTPFITRTLVQILGASYAVSWLWDPYFALANIPQFTVGRFELYRLFTSFLVNTRLSTIIFVAFGFVQQGKRLEESIGSTSFAYLCSFIGITSNILFTIALYGLTWASGDAAKLTNGTAGMWQVLFGIIAIECVQAPRSSRPFLFCKVPTLYYPLVLYAIIAFVSQGGASGSLVSLGIGYLSGFGKLEPVTNLSQSRITQLESRLLVNWSRKPGWVKSEEILGSGAWNHSDEESSGLSLPTRIQPGIQTTTGFQPGDGNSQQPIPSGGEGRTLGSSTTRRATDPRTARLQTLERNGAA